MVYGVVQYDFKAERPDELEAKAEEAIIVIAQSNPEWFVAKPIGRLGGPGLIPVSFIEIKDTATGEPVVDAHEAVQRAGVPRVEEWKKMAAEYKKSSINVGKQDAHPKTSSEMGRTSFGGASMQHPHPSANGYVSSCPSFRSPDPCTRVKHFSAKLKYCADPYGQGLYQPPSSQSGVSQGSLSQMPQQPLLAPISASLPRYCFDNDMYWYIIECQMEDGQHWELSRYYTDFYDFQIALLEEFPEEAGNRGLPRTLPFMPGPVAHVTDAISNGRRQNLDEYIRKILSMPPHISRCHLVRKLFAPRQGDFEIDPNAVGEDYRLSSVSQHSTLNDRSASASRQSSSSAMNGGAYSGMPPPSGRPYHSRGQPSLSGNPGQGGAGGVGGNSGFLQPMNRQASSLTQASASSSNAAASGGWVKIKVMFQDELILIRVPSDITYLQLQDKLKDRLKLSEDLFVQYRDDPTNANVDLNNDTDLDIALQRNAKLTLLVARAS